MADNFVAKGSERITIDDTAGGVGFTAGSGDPDNNTANTWNKNGVRQAVCRVENQEIRIQTDPDVTVLAGSVGIEKPAGAEFIIVGYDDMKNFKAIRTGGTSGVLEVIYEGTSGG